MKNANGLASVTRGGRYEGPTGINGVLNATFSNSTHRPRRLAMFRTMSRRSNPPATWLCSSP